MPQILFVEDDKDLSAVVNEWLTADGYTVEVAHDGLTGWEFLRQYNYDVVILDWNLPGLSGPAMCGRYRAAGGVAPVIMLTAKSQITEKVEGFDSGVDDYLTKPFSVPELLARIRVILRRHSSDPAALEQNKSEFKIGSLLVDDNKRRVWLNDDEIHLTPNEYKVLALLIKHQGKVLTHKFIIENIWGGMLDDDTQSLRVCMGNLRRKLKEDPAEPHYIITEIGVGYRLADE